jgi:predicted aconitase
MTTIELSDEERKLARDEAGPAAGLAMRLVAETAGWLGARRLLSIASAHIDGCLYHGDSGVEFARRLAGEGARVAVPTTLNVGALDLIHPERVRADPERRAMARALMDAYVAMGCAPTWTCAPYQAGHRPAAGSDVAWGESNAVVFCNSVLGARTNRYGDFLDICCALTARAPDAGLHRPENRRARVVVETHALSRGLRDADAFYPALGAWLGAELGETVAVIAGLPANLAEDRLKALGAAAASEGAVGLFHVAGSTPEAPDVETALGGFAPERTIALTPAMIRAARDALSTVAGDQLDAVALGSPHFSPAEFAAFERLRAGRRFARPVYICTGRGVLAELAAAGTDEELRAAGVVLVADTCVVVTPILPAGGGVVMTSSGKFAHYTPANTGYEVVYGSLADCVESALTGRIERDESLWN